MESSTKTASCERELAEMKEKIRTLQCDLNTANQKKA